MRGARCEGNSILLPVAQSPSRPIDQGATKPSKGLTHTVPRQRMATLAVSTIRLTPPRRAKGVAGKRKESPSFAARSARRRHNLHPLARPALPVPRHKHRRHYYWILRLPFLLPGWQAKGNNLCHDFIDCLSSFLRIPIIIIPLIGSTSCSVLPLTAYRPSTPIMQSRRAGGPSGFVAKLKKTTMIVDWSPEIPWWMAQAYGNNPPSPPDDSSRRCHTKDRPSSDTW